MVLCCGACGNGAAAGPDAGTAAADAARPPDARVGLDGAAPLGWVDFTATGCRILDPAGPGCRGDAPLTLRFVPIAPAPIDTYLWSFGDGSPAESSALPEHTYVTPGVFDVTLTVAGAGGTATASHATFVFVDPAALGARCDGDAQCASGACACADGACQPDLGGFCTTPCDGATPCDDGVCVDLGDAAAGWQRPLCLASCAEGDACAPGFACRELVQLGGGFVRACFAPGVPGEVGASCVAASGGGDGAACSTGTCAALGARGTCSLACDTDADCPASAACATFTAGDRWCVARCDAFACDADPWLACEVADATGDLGFSVGAPAAAGYCAPRRCLDPIECPGGTCANLGGAGFCVASP